MIRFALALAAAVVFALPASAQVESREGIALQNQILELRRDIEALRAGAGGGGAARLPPPVSGSGGGGGASADMVARMQALEEQLRGMRGQLDEAQNSNRQLRADIEKLRGDIEFRLDALEKGGGAARPAAPANPTAANPTRPGQSPPPAQPAAAGDPFAAAQAALRANQFQDAERGFKDFVSRNPRDPRAAEAYFGIGRALQGRREWAQAALAYDESQRRFPRGSFAQESLLGLGQSLHGLGDKSAACQAYARLSSEFADSMKPAVRTSLGAARQQSGCR
jgi:TolA-binding protein